MRGRPNETLFDHDEWRWASSYEFFCAIMPSKVAKLLTKGNISLEQSMKNEVILFPRDTSPFF